jgi:chain length determinant protein tyrosine kinase EpsG
MQDNLENKSQNTVAINPARVSKIGKLLLKLGKITTEDTEKILRVQQEEGLLFGDAAMKLGLINDADIQQVVAMQFDYHYLQAGQGDFSKELVAAYEPFSQQVEAYRALRSQLMMRWFKGGNRALAFVSPNHSEGISYLTANLAVVFSQLGARTLLIDANMRSPRQHVIFNLKTSKGLSDIIVGRAGLEAVAEIEAIQDLYVLSAGTVPPNPQELLGRASFSYLMKIVQENYDVVILDCPPANECADALSIAALAKGAFLVCRLNHTDVTDLANLRNNLEITRTDIVGAVINDF